jgi:ADP-ribose pyrophosphatase YjhB (NUDIX family)
MNNDISVMINNKKLNIRVGIIFKYEDKVLVEVPKYNFYNSVVPGGRIKIGEYSIDAIKREIKEEMGFELLDSKLGFVKTLEEMFTFNNIDYHEIFFIYKYNVDYDDYNLLLKIKDNQDNANSYYKFITKEEFNEYNLLPLEIRDIINEK